MVTGSRDIDVCSARFLGPKFGREGLQRARLRFSGFLSRRESLSLPPGELSFPAARSADEPGSPARREALPPGTLPPGALSLPAGGRAGWLAPAGRESVLLSTTVLRIGSNLPIGNPDEESAPSPTGAPWLADAPTAIQVGDGITNSTARRYNAGMLKFGRIKEPHRINSACSKCDGHSTDSDRRGNCLALVAATIIIFGFDPSVGARGTELAPSITSDVENRPQI